MASDQANRDAGVAAAYGGGPATNQVTYTIKFRGTQGTLMRILGQVTRRAIPLERISAVPGTVTVILDVTPKQDEQLRRDWGSTIDVEEVLYKPRVRSTPEDWNRILDSTLDLAQKMREAKG